VGIRLCYSRGRNARDRIDLTDEISSVPSQREEKKRHFGFRVYGLQIYITVRKAVLSPLLRGTKFDVKSLSLSLSLSLLFSRKRRKLAGDDGGSRNTTPLCEFTWRR